MRVQILAVIAVLAAGAAAAQPVSENPPKTTIQCIDVGGLLIPPDCRVQASRLNAREDICTCPAGGDRVPVAVCQKGQTAPPEGKKLNIARREGLKDGSLIGDTIDGRPICVAPRNDRY